MYVYMGIRRKSYDVLPATGPSWFPPLATMLKGEKRRQNEGGTIGRDGVMEQSGNAFLVLRLGSKSLCQLGNNTDMLYGS